VAEILDLLGKGDVLIEVRRLVRVGRLAAIVGVGKGLLSHVDFVADCSDDRLCVVLS